MKGMHPMVYSWRPYRDVEGCKLQSKDIWGAIYDREIIDWENEEGPEIVGSGNSGRTSGRGQLGAGSGDPTEDVRRRQSTNGVHLEDGGTNT